MINGSSGGPCPHLEFVVEEPLLAGFFMLLQQGVGIRRRVGCSIEIFLRQEIGAGPGLVEKIQSIVLDGKPVDDIRSALVRDGSVLALSAAMPGLVGATLRRGGTYSSFRSGITHHETGQACEQAEGLVEIKLFNLLMAELGPGLLRQGVLVKSRDLTDFLSERFSELRPGCRRIMQGNRPVDKAAFFSGDRERLGTGRVFLTVAAGPVRE
jgi:hypothetical protein